MIDFESHRSDKIEYIYNQLDLNLNFQKHTHRSFEITYVYDGELSCEVEGRTYNLHKNECILILPGQIHSYKTIDFCKSYLCVFSNDWVIEFYKEIKGSHLENPVFNIDNDFVLRVLQDESSDRFLIKAVLYGLCSKALTSTKLIKSNEANFALINSLAFYIQDNYKNNINLKDIAKDFGYNYSYLSSFFNDNFGMNFASYVNNYRVQLVKEYLIKTDMDITEISTTCGFGTIRNFNRIFKNICGISPSQYRESFRNDES